MTLSESAAEKLPQKYERIYDDTFNVGFGFSVTGDITTSANFGTLLAAEPGYRWVLRGGYIYVRCTTVCAGAAAFALLHLQDGTTVTSASRVVTVGSYEASTTAAGTVITEPVDDTRGRNFHFHFEECPRRSIDIGNGLFLRGGADISTGVFGVGGCIWGWKENV